MLILGKPQTTNAGFFDSLLKVVTGSSTSAAEIKKDDFGTDNFNLSNMQLLESRINPDNKNSKDEIYLNTTEGALESNSGIYGYGLENESLGEIIPYTVVEGDTLSSIAELFDVSINTIKWENNITGKTIKIGQVLNILPVSGVKHVVKKGDTIEKIASKYDAQAEDIEIYNDVKNSTLKQGDIIYVPNGIIKPVVIVTKTNTPKKITTISSSTNTDDSGYYLRPSEGRITSPFGPRRGGYHYGIDIGNQRGTPIIAAASGIIKKTVTHCKEGNRSCGGRYGNYVEIEHSNGTITIYAHMKDVFVTTGQIVSKGENIGTIGNTGRSTGPHLHFEIERENGSKARPSF